MQMICESRYYKEELLLFAQQIERWLAGGRWTDRRWYEFERGLLFSAFVIRRLTESKVLTDAIANQKVPLHAYKPLGRPATLFNRRRLERLFDLARPSEVERPLAFVANQLIHSYVLNYWKEKDRTGITFFFSSDWERKKVAHTVSTMILVPVLRAVGSDYSDRMEARFNDKRGDYDVCVYSTTPRVLRSPWLPRLTKR
jgi:hypothetical protein